VSGDLYVSIRVAPHPDDQLDAVLARLQTPNADFPIEWITIGVTTSPEAIAAA